MKSLKYLFTLLLFFAVVPLFAQQNKEDPVSVVDVKFKKIQANEIQCSEGQWTRIEVMLLINGNPDENANNQQWVRNIDVGLTLVYKDEKARDKKSLDNLLVMKSKARLFAGKVNAKVPVVFYVPSEAYFVYRLAQDAFAWSIDLTVNGSPIKLSKNNYKKLLSKEISSSNNVVKVLENYNKLVSKAASANEGVLLPLPGSGQQPLQHSLQIPGFPGACAGNHKQRYYKECGLLKCYFHILNRGLFSDFIIGEGIFPSLLCLLLSVADSCSVLSPFLILRLVEPHLKMFAVEHSIFKMVIETNCTMRTNIYTQTAINAGTQVVMISSKLFLLLAFFIDNPFRLYADCTVRAGVLTQTASYTKPLTVFTGYHLELRSMTLGHLQCCMSVLRVLLSDLLLHHHAHGRIHTYKKAFRSTKISSDIFFKTTTHFLIYI